MALVGSSCCCLSWKTLHIKKVFCNCSCRCKVNEVCSSFGFITAEFRRWKHTWVYRWRDCGHVGSILGLAGVRWRAQSTSKICGTSFSFLIWVKTWRDTSLLALIHYPVARFQCLDEIVTCKFFHSWVGYVLEFIVLWNINLVFIVLITHVSRTTCNRGWITWWLVIRFSAACWIVVQSC